MRNHKSLMSIVVCLLVVSIHQNSLKAQTTSPVQFQPYCAADNGQTDSVFSYSETKHHVASRTSLAKQTSAIKQTSTIRPSSKASKSDFESAKEFKASQSTESQEVRDEPSSNSLTNWPNKSLVEIRINPFVGPGEVPADRSNQLLGSYIRDWRFHDHCEKVLMWSAPNIRYQPLFFEDVALERYGNVFRNEYMQTAVSAVHFFSSASLWPLHALHDPAFSCDYPLGYCRPGNCSNRIFQRQFWGRRR